jgi:hypothetical protein
VKRDKDEVIWVARRLDEIPVLRPPTAAKKKIKKPTGKGATHLMTLDERRLGHWIGDCPKCGEHLVLRGGSYGDFLACPNYPD